ncbi:MAG: hypothetical protein ACHQDY_00775 [Solirubrobacterales bacterium]
MAVDPPGPRFALRVDETTLAEDLAHASESGRAAIVPLFDNLERKGVPSAWLKRCQSDHTDGTNLSGCVKLYIPQPVGPWGAVFTGDRIATTPIVVLLAIGLRHPTQPWMPSVYQIAHRRLHGTV